uniref:Single-strand selective monofunctional uracil-DNA glycosylase n=5 Tax=Cacopsylla melanoneura TaxID=428564 RepID=A0A8D8SGH6_9HEMI
MKTNLVGLLLLCQSKNIFMSANRLSAGMKRKSTTSVEDERNACENDVAEGVLNIEKQLIHELTNNNLSYDSSIEYIYNPLDYAFELHSKYVHKYCSSKKKILFLGMNPGPWGMVQCGIPFGEVKAVKGFLNIEGNVNQPDKFHKDRPITGLDCPRSEISGKRLWDLASQLSEGKAEDFFRHAYVHNYFPLAFLSKTAKNITPAELKNKITIEKLNSICDKSLAQIVQHLGVDTVIAIGKFAETRAEKALKTNSITGVKVTSISHPSPRNPASNKNWVENTTKKLKEIGVLKYFKKGTK